MKSPFKFLDAYNADERHLFFGREEEIEQLYRMVFQTDVLLVYGQSGTGKTSLIQCGLANRMQDSDWFEVPVRRRSDLNASLHAALDKAAQTPFEKGATLNEKVESLFLDYFKPIFLIFDQFEELFVLGDEEEYEAFVKEIHSLLKAGLNCTLIFVTREEYLGQLYHFEKQVPQLLDKRLRVEPMGLNNVQKVIQGSCEAFDITLETPEVTVPKIVDQISAGKSGVQLAYLQIYLDRLYREGGTTFTPALVDKVGDITDVLGDFLSEQQKAVQQAVKTAFPKAPDTTIRQLLNECASLEGTKRPLKREELQLAGTSEAAITFSLKHLEDARILRFNDGLYELAHDTLALHIAQGRNERERSLMEVVQIIRNGFRGYERTQRLLTERELQIVALHEEDLKMAHKLKEAEWSYLHQSRAELTQEKRKQSRLRMMVIGALVLFSLFAGWQWYVAEQERDASQRALANFWMSEAGRKMVEYDFTTAFRLAQHSKKENPELAEVDSVLEEVRSHLADGQGRGAKVIDRGKYICFFDQYNDVTRQARMNLWRRLPDQTYVKRTFPDIAGPFLNFNRDSSALAIFQLVDQPDRQGIYHLLSTDSLTDIAQVAGIEDNHFWLGAGQYFAYEAADSGKKVFFLELETKAILPTHEEFRDVKSDEGGFLYAIYSFPKNGTYQFYHLKTGWRDSILNVPSNSRLKFSPMQERLCFLRQGDRYNENDLYIRTLNTGEEQLIASKLKDELFLYEWSADGKCLAYITERDYKEDIAKVSYWSISGNVFQPNNPIAYDLAPKEDKGFHFCKANTHKIAILTKEESSSTKGTLIIWDYMTGEKVVHEAIHSFKLNPDSTVILASTPSSGLLNQLLVIDLLTGHTQSFDQIGKYQIHPDQRRIMGMAIPAGEDRRVPFYWKMDSDELVIWRGPAEYIQVEFTGFSEDGKYALGMADKRYYRAKRSRYSSLYFMNLETANVDSISGWDIEYFSHSLDGNYLGFSEGDTLPGDKRTLFIYNLATREKWNLLSDEEDPVYKDDRFIFGHKKIALMQGDRTIAFYDLETRKKICTVSHQRKLTGSHVSFPPNSPFAITYDEGHWRKIIRLDTPLTLDYFDKILPPLDEEARKRYHILE